MNITILGFSKASVTADYLGMMVEAGHAVTIQEPDSFLAGNFSIDTCYIISVTRDLNLRQQLARRLDSENLPRATFIHGSCWIHPTATIESGTFIGPFCSVASNAKIGKDCLLAPYCFVGHVSTLGDNCLLNPGVMIPGSCNVSAGCKFNIRSTLVDHIAICSGTEVGAGALLTKSTELPGKYIGIPARRVK
jgi:UDP-3-O-[3-hydroxymyristoyl] glucosamine N-acyltransferase